MTQDIPSFEGRPVEGVVTVIKGVSHADLDLIVAHDDLVQLTALFKVSQVDFPIDKDGNLIRRQFLTLQEVAPQPFDMSDPNDDGVQRLLGKPGRAQVATSGGGGALPPSSSAPAATSDPEDD